MRILVLLLTFAMALLPAVMAKTLVGEVSIDDVPPEFFGSWEVTSIFLDTTDPFLQVPISKDTWNLSRKGDVITLSNLESGAVASVTLDEVDGQSIKFTRRGEYKNQVELETPELTLDGENFTGIDTIIIKKYKYGQLVKEDMVRYKIIGQKVSGPKTEELLR